MIPGGKTDLFSGPGYLNNFPEVLPLQVYSYLSDFTGFRFATLHVWELTVSNATAKAIAGPAMKAQTCIGVWKLNLPRKIFPKSNAMGMAMKKAMASHFV
jgi:hypothetical protein